MGICSPDAASLPLNGGLMNCAAKKTGTGVWIWIGYTTERACW